jgi:Na+/melibiose symporter and related transporters
MADSEKSATPVVPTHTGKKAHYATAPEDRVSRPTKILYAMGAGADNAGFNGPKQLANPVYNIALGLNPALITTVIAITRLWDAFTDPFMGKVTDNAKGGRFGRRRPFMLLGIVLCALLFPVIWMAPGGLGQWGMFAFLLVTMLLFYTAFTIYTVPFSAQGFELTPDYHERTRVHAYYAFFGNLSIIPIMWLYRLTQLEIFDNVHQGAVTVSFAFGGLMLILGLMPVFFVKAEVFRNVKGIDEQTFLLARA